MTYVDSPRPNIPLGLWRHYKGGLYRLLHVAQSEQTLGWLCVYRSTAPNDGRVWVRTVADWTWIVDGEPRFVFIE